MKLFFRLCLCTLIIALCACGQKGKLIIPTKPAAISTPYPMPENAPAPATAAPTPAQ